MFKKIKDKYLLFLGFLFVFIILNVGIVHALEVDLGLGENPSIGDYVSFLFTTIITIGVTLAIASFAIGAIGLISPNIEAHGDAKDRMKGAILGVLLMTTSWIIINEINPKLEDLNLNNKLLGETGVFLTGGEGGKTIQCPQTVPYVSEIAPYETIQYKCDKGPKLMVWMFPNINMEEGASTSGSSLEQVTVSTISCGGTVSISGKSFKWAYEDTGVYYYLDSACTKYASMANVSSTDNVGYPFVGQMKGVKIISDDSSGEYGVLFHRATDLKKGGECGLPITKQNQCTPVDINFVVSADIFSLNTSEDSSGDGVDFYSEPYGWDSGANAGYYTVYDNVIKPPFKEQSASGVKFIYDGIDVPDGYQQHCSTFDICPGSIAINGTYLVAVYSGSNYCQTFTDDVPNLNAQPVTDEGGEIQTIRIVPIY